MLFVCVGVTLTSFRPLEAVRIVRELSTEEEEEEVIAGYRIRRSQHRKARIGKN